MKSKVLGIACSATALILSVGVAPANAGAITSAKGTFVSGSSTDRLRSVDGKVKFTQPKKNGTITVSGNLSGLEANKLYVAVPYKDGACLPTPGITAFPSGAFQTNGTGAVVIPNGVTVNPKAINPLGTFNVSQTRSISVRQVVIQAVSVPGIPAGTPTVPNIVQPEACTTRIVLK